MLLRVASLASLAAILAVAAGPLLAYAGLVSPMGGFVVFVLAVPTGLAGLVAAAWGLVKSGSNVDEGAKARGWSALMVSVVSLVLVLGPAVAARDYPPINDITTNTDDPPAFVHAGSLAANAGRDLSYPGPSFAETQRAAYPDLDSVLLNMDPAKAQTLLRQALAGLERTEITAETVGRIEAVSRSLVFGFADDVVVRIRPEGSGARVDLRSKSRDGRGDLGANAERIRSILDSLGGA